MRLLTCLYVVGCLFLLQPARANNAFVAPAETLDVQFLTERVSEEMRSSDRYGYDPEKTTEQILEKLIGAIDEDKDLSLFIKAVATNEQAYIYDILVQVGFIAYANQLKSTQLQDILQYTAAKYPNRIRFAAAHAIAFFSKETEGPDGTLKSLSARAKFSLQPEERRLIASIFALARPEDENSREYYLFTSVLSRVYQDAQKQLKAAQKDITADESARRLFSVVVFPKPEGSMESPLIDEAEKVAAKNVESGDSISLVAVKGFLFVQTRAEFFEREKYKEFVDKVYTELFKDLGISVAD